MKLKIREWEDMKKEFGLDKYGDIKCYNGFTKDMREYCGEVFEVHEVFPRRGLFVYNGWVFSDDMYEIVEDLRGIKMGIKMKVRIREWAEMEKEFGLDKYGGIKCYDVFVRAMRKYCGKVIEVDKDKVSSIKGVFAYNNWIFTDDMYEIIEE